MKKIWLLTAGVCVALALAGCGNGQQAEQPITNQGQEVLEINPEVTKEGRVFAQDFLAQIQAGNLEFVVSHYPQGKFEEVAELKPNNKKQAAMMSAIMQKVSFDKVEIIPIGGNEFNISFVAKAPVLSEGEYTQEQLTGELDTILAAAEKRMVNQAFTIRLDKVEGEWQIIEDYGLAYFMTGEAGAFF